MSTLRFRRYQVHYGRKAGHKGYIVTDAGPNPQTIDTTNVIFTTDNKGEAEQRATDLNAEEEHENRRSAD